LLIGAFVFYSTDSFFMVKYFLHLTLPHRQIWSGRLTQSKKFGDLNVIENNTNGRSGWVVCLCWCGNLRIVLERRLLAGESVACVPCEVRRKMEKQVE
jgi:hypothetical protein